MRALLILGFLVIALGASCDDPTGPNLSDVPGYLISSVRVSPGADTLFVPDTIRSFDRVTFTASALGKSGGPVPISRFAWTTSDPAIAVIDQFGVVTPITTGTVEIQASADKIGRATLVILPATMSVSIEPAVDTIFIGSTAVPGDTIRLRATARDLTGAVLGGVIFQWSSSSPSVATVDATGLVSAVDTGVTDITVSANNHNAAARVHVIQNGAQSN
jgi:uncharacterized protein YjdB